MKKIKIDSVMGLFFNFILIIMLFVAWGGEDFHIIAVLPMIAIFIEFSVLMYKFDEKEIEKNTMIKYGSKLILALSFVLVIINNVTNVCWFCHEVKLLNIVLMSMLVIFVISVVYVEFTNKKLSN